MKKFTVLSLVAAMVITGFIMFAANAEATRGGLFSRLGQRQNVRVQRVVVRQPVRQQFVQKQRVVVQRQKFVPVRQNVKVLQVQNHHHFQNQQVLKFRDVHRQAFVVEQRIPIRTTRIVEVPGYHQVQELRVVKSHGRIQNVEKVQVQQFNKQLQRSRLQGNKIIIQQNVRGY